MEGVVYSCVKRSIFSAASNVPVSEIRAPGGGAKSPFWRQIQADAYGLKVVTLNSEEGPGLARALAAVAGGEYSNIQEACDATISTVSELQPNPEATAYYDKAFPVYQKLYQSLKDDFKTIAELQ